MADAGSLKGDDPLVLAMADIVNSPECREACVLAVENGWPAIAGADPYLAKAFKAEYGKHNMATNWAGRLVANVMRNMGYRMVGKMASLPPGCVAQSGELWEKRLS